MTNILSVDPGAKGALFLLGPNRVWDMPHIKTTRGKLQVFSELDEIISEVLAYGDLDVFTIEEQRSFGKEGRNSMMTIGRNYQMFFDLAYFHNINTCIVYPRDWKEYHNLIGTDKEASVFLAEEMFPEVAFRTPRGRKLDGRADAALMAVYWRDVLKGTEGAYEGI